MTTKERELQQMSALQQANHVRWGMTALRREIRGTTDWSEVADLLDNPPELLARMTVDYFLNSLHRVGSTRAARIAHDADIPIGLMGRRIGPMEQPTDRYCMELTPDQRQRLAERLRSG